MPVMTTATMAMTSVLLPAVTFRWRYYSSFFLLPPNVDFHTGQQQRFLSPSQVPPSASQLHCHSLLSAAGSTFFLWSGATLWWMLYFLMRLLWFAFVSLHAGLHLALIKPSAFKSCFISFVASHRILSSCEREKVLLMYLLLFWTASLFVSYAY